MKLARKLAPKALCCVDCPVFACHFMTPIIDFEVEGHGSPETKYYELNAVGPEVIPRGLLFWS